MATHTTYEDSRGRTHVIADMPYTYLKNAARKLEVNGDNPAMLESLNAEIARRDEIYRQQQEAEGNLG